MLTACDNNDDKQPDSTGTLQITASIGDSNLSRAENSEWQKGDCIGISSIVGEFEGPYVNVMYTTLNGDGVFTGSPLFFYKPMTLTAYYPFNGTEKSKPGVDGIISATADSIHQKNLPAIDFLWDTRTGVNKADFSAENPKVNFTFAHKMSKMTFTFQSSDPVFDKNNPDIMLSDGVDVGKMVSYEIEGLGVKGSFNTATGVCSIDESVRDGLKMTFGKSIGEAKVEEREFPSIIVFPQKKPEGDNFILHIVTDELNGDKDPEQKYKCALRFTDDEIKAGCHYKFTIKVTKLGLILGDITIDDWVESDRFIVATIDGEEVFKE